MGINSDNAIPPAQGADGDLYNLYLPTSVSSGHYYNVVVYLMMRFFDCSPPTDYFSKPATNVALNGSVLSRSNRWTCPSSAPCEANQRDCEVPASTRIRPCFKDSPPEHHCADYQKIVLHHTNDSFPCHFEHANAVIPGKAWTACAKSLGLDDRSLWNDRNILSAMSFMFDNDIPATATAVGGNTEATAVPVTGSDDLRGAAIAGFSFGSGYVCPNFSACEQPGLTNTALASVAIRSVQHTADRDGRGKTNLFLQWEVAAAAASLLGIPRTEFTGSGCVCRSHGLGEVCVWKVGDGGAYLGTADIWSTLASELPKLKITKLVHLAAPDHLPRVYRTGLKMLQTSSIRITLLPAMIPFNLNYPVTAGAALINVYENSPFMQESFGLSQDNPQDWVRNRMLFRLYELQCYADHGGAGYAHLPTSLIADDAMGMPLWKQIFGLLLVALLAALAGYSANTRGYCTRCHGTTPQGSDPSVGLLA